MLTESFIVIRNEDNTTYAMTYDGILMDIFFRTLSRHYAFSDCSGEDVIAVFWKGKEIQYVGWQPNMRYEYKDLSGNTVWVGNFPEWDH